MFPKGGYGTASSFQPIYLHVTYILCILHVELKDNPRRSSILLTLVGEGKRIVAYGHRTEGPWPTKVTRECIPLLRAIRNQYTLTIYFTIEFTICHNNTTHHHKTPL